MKEDLAAPDAQPGVDVHQLTGREELPVGVIVEAFAGDDDRGPVAEIGGVDPDPAVLSGAVQVLVAVLPACRPLEDPEFVSGRVAQRPQRGGGSEDQVQ